MESHGAADITVAADGMTYYEELGVPPSASIEEIRQAYRRVVRLVHPDQCGDEEMRRLADLQMKRLNAMLALLCDPRQRAVYDASLIGPPALIRQAPKLQPLRRTQAIYAFAAAALLGLGIGFRPHNRVTPRPAPERAAALPAKPTETKRTATHLHGAAPRHFVPAAPPEVAAKTIDPPLIATRIPIEPVIPLRPDPPAASPPEVPRTPPSLSGRWLFVSSTEVRTEGYPPEYIELRLSESGGVLHGHYQARYRITDRAISPNVAFQFDGHAGDEGGVLPWQGPGGSEGEITLRLLPSGNLEVDWVAHRLGRDLGLISGTSTLVRKLE